MRRNRGVKVDEVNEDLYYPHVSNRPLRIAMRILGPLFRAELFQQVCQRVKITKPDIVFIVKGVYISDSHIDEIKILGPKIVLRFPDYSPFVHGERLKCSAGRYDLVVSAKPLHPQMWRETYHYTNRCVCVPHGYNPELHLQNVPPDNPTHDVVMVASARPEYLEILDALAGSDQTASLNVAIGGDGWEQSRAKFPSHWNFIGPARGEAYIAALRSGKIVVAPITTYTMVDGVRQTADVDTARSYEIAAAYCCFIHRRSDYIAGIYNENTEVPLFSSGEDLVAKILYYLPRAEERRHMAEAAHRRAVPSYSIDARAAQIIEHLHALRPE